MVGINAVRSVLCLAKSRPSINGRLTCQPVSARAGVQWDGNAKFGPSGSIVNHMHRGARMFTLITIRLQSYAAAIIVVQLFNKYR